MRKNCGNSRSSHAKKCRIISRVDRIALFFNSLVDHHAKKNVSKITNLYFFIILLVYFRIPRLAIVKSCLCVYHPAPQRGDATRRVEWLVAQDAIMAPLATKHESRYLWQMATDLPGFQFLLTQTLFSWLAQHQATLRVKSSVDVLGGNNDGGDGSGAPLGDDFVLAQME